MNMQAEQSRLVSKKWEKMDVFTDPDMSIPYPFELGEQ